MEETLLEMKRAGLTGWVDRIEEVLSMSTEDRRKLDNFTEREIERMQKENETGWEEWPDE